MGGFERRVNSEFFGDGKIIIKEVTEKEEETNNLEIEGR